MFQFQQTNDGYVFLKDGRAIALGVYSDKGFDIIYKNIVSTFGNPLSAYLYVQNNELSFD